jgi:hypothetical protein
LAIHFEQIEKGRSLEEIEAKKSVAFNEDNNKLYFFGGNGGDHATLIYSDLLEWDGKKWTPVERGKIYKWDIQKDMFINTQ